MADAYKAQVEAMGGDNIARLKIVEAIAQGQVKVVPEILVSSNGPDGNLNDILTLFFTQKIAEDAAKQTKALDIKKAEEAETV